jgi:hypothetical protein
MPLKISKRSVLFASFLFSFLLQYFLQSGGDEGTRTPDFRLAKAALSQLSYIPGITALGEWA